MAAVKTAKDRPFKVVKGGRKAAEDTPAKKGSEKAAAAAEPYDQLSQTRQDLWDEIGKMGFRPERASSGFIASEINWDTDGDGEPRRFGPFESLVILHNEVRDE